MRRGSITVFMSLTIMLVMSLFFTLAEGIHQKLLSNQKTLLAIRTTENMEAMYNKILWEEFGILGVDAGFGRDCTGVTRFQNKAEGYLWDAIQVEGVDFCRFQDAALEVKNYAYITDQDGAAFIQEAVDQLKYQVADSLIEEWTGQFSKVTGDSEEMDDVEDLINKGKDASEELEKSGEVKNTGYYTHRFKRSGVVPMVKTENESIEGVEGESEENKYEGEDNPLDTIDLLMSDGILSLALPEGFEVSDAAISISESDRVSGRTLNSGTATDLSDASVAEQLLLEQYFILTNQSAISDKGRDELKYEMEYILCGKDSDRENLEGTLLRILAIREAENLLAINNDPAKIAEADSYAVAVTTATATPYLFEAVKWGIIAVWALIESVLDLRTILDGGKVAILKTKAEWTSELLNFSSYLGAGKKAKESEIGLGYNDYLRILMLFESKEKLTYRAMDLCEMVIRNTENYENFRMDHVLVKADMNYSFQASAVFFSFVPELQGKYNVYQTEEVNQFSYL